MGKKNNIQKAAVKPRRKLVFFSVLGKMGLAKLPILQKLG